MNFNYLNLFQPIENTEDYHIGKPNGKTFLFGTEKKYNYVGESLLSFETSDKIVASFLKEGFNDVR